MTDEYPIEEIKDSPVFRRSHCGKPTFNSGDLVMGLKWNIIGMVSGPTYMYLGEECCNFETIWGPTFEEFPVASLRTFVEEEGIEGNIPRCDCAGEESRSRSLLAQSDEWSIPQSVGVSDYEWVGA